MNRDLHAVFEVLKLNTRLLPYTLKGVSDEDVICRPDNKGNSMHFIAGHMLESRNILMQMMGLPVETKWGKLFTLGAKIVEQSKYPAISEIKDEWEKVSAKLLQALEEISEEKLTEKAPFEFPIDDETILGGIIFLAYHDSYHMGQLGYLRPYFGYSQIAG